MKYISLFLLFLIFPVIIFSNENPIWLETDSITAIKNRIISDFSLSMNDAKTELIRLYPQINLDSIDSYAASKFIEIKIIDGEKRMHRKSPRNFKLLNPSLSNWIGRGANADTSDIKTVELIISKAQNPNNHNLGKRICYKFSIDVPYHNFLVNDTLKVWMPVPIESQRQENFKIISVSHDNYILSKDQGSEHNTLYIEQGVDSIISDSILHFEYVGEYDVYGQYFSPDYITNNIKPYNKNSEVYKKYTDLNHKHIICDSLAFTIVGQETCPYRQSELIYEYISKTYPWAGAREYSTIESLPQYVLDEAHGDCGQVALLYISLMRTLGVPARWESGWMLHPWDKNLHDWAEVYFEGVGWVPVDVSFGRFISSNDEKVKNFYSTGIDYFRFATNTGICSPLYPNKKYIRSETVDFQMGEVECSKGNLFYPGWKKRLEVITIKDICNENK